MQIVYAKSVQGQSHKKREAKPENIEAGRLFPCEDRSFAEKDLTAADGTQFSFLCVCDGHGGAPYFRSGRGAELAIEVLKDILTRNMANIRPMFLEGKLDKIRASLAKSIITRWKACIDEELKANPVTEEELAFLEMEDSAAAETYRKGEDLYSIFGCTMVAYFSADNFWYALQIGDGAFAASYDGKKFFMPVPEDPNCFLNQTTSMCDSDAEKEFRHAFGLGYLPLSVFCMSDGVENSFGSPEATCEKFCSAVAALPASPELNSPGSSDAVRLELFEKEIDDFLPILSTKGSGDDVSVAMIVPMN